MNVLFVVSNPRDWPEELPGVTVVPARAYLTDPRYFDARAAKVFNLCRSYRYQSAGYYVSLLAAARGHRPIPSLATIQDLRSQPVARILSTDVEDLVARTLKHVGDDDLTLRVYFGRHPEPRFARLAWHLFSLFEAPLLRVEFRCRDGEWAVRSVRAIDASDVPDDERPTLVQAAINYFAEKKRRAPRRRPNAFDLAILADPSEMRPPSNTKALERFEAAAERVGFNVEWITRDDAGRLAEFDALFIRETTSVNHHTFRIARRAEAKGLVVIDDPESILRCTNKVYLSEVLARNRVAAPKTLVVHAGNIQEIEPTLRLPVVLKQPDSSFSQGVVKADTAAQVAELATKMLAQSELIVAQEFQPTDFDWRVGVFERQPLYVCKYFMAERHWQIIGRDESGRTIEGDATTLAVEDAPREVIRTALRAANLIGDGLYGVDLKQHGEKITVIEVNDNPSIDAGYEDAVRKTDLYEDIMSKLLARVVARKQRPRLE